MYSDRDKRKTKYSFISCLYYTSGYIYLHPGIYTGIYMHTYYLNLQCTYIVCNGLLSVGKNNVEEWDRLN